MWLRVALVELRSHGLRGDKACLGKPHWTGAYTFTRACRRQQRMQHDMLSMLDEHGLPPCANGRYVQTCLRRRFEQAQVHLSFAISRVRVQARALRC